MKVLELVESAAAGVGRHVVDLTAGLLARGHQVHLLYSELRSDQTFASDLRRLKKHSSFHALQVSMRQWPSRSDIHAIRVLREYMRTHGPFDLVHCHSTKAGLIGRVGLVGHPGKRLYTPHMFFTMRTTGALPIRWAVAMLEASLSRLCHGVIAVSREERSHAVELGIAPAKICVIPNGVPLDQSRLSFRSPRCDTTGVGTRPGRGVYRICRPPHDAKISTDIAAFVCYVSALFDRFCATRGDRRRTARRLLAPPGSRTQHRCARQPGWADAMLAR